VLRPFAAPVTEHAAAEQPAGLPAAPQIAAEVSAAALPEMRSARVLRSFAVPQATVAVAAAAPLAEAPAFKDRPSEAALAIVGLFPAREVPIPKPQNSQKAGFSTGPQPQAEGGDASSDTKLLAVPGLLVRNDASDSRPNLVAALGSPTSRANLDAAARSVQSRVAGRTVDPHAARLATVPDPRLAGRLVYRIAIQMPNVSSYSGSWMVWFAERDPVPDQPVSVMRAPAPLRKVDPKYTRAAWDEKVEGKVRLAAVIRKDGHVDRVELLQHVDSRLDQSSQEALAKWEFEPALRDGVAIDVDAVFEIPFRILPQLPAK
jgi:TonB family protein